MKPSIVRLAIIGCGAVVRRHHLPVLINNKSIDITSICDKDLNAADEIKNKFDLKCKLTDDPLKVFSMPDVDVVDICTPGATHFDLALQAIRNGKHVLLEKPPVMHLAEANLLIREARERKLKIGTIFNNRYRYIIEELRKKIDVGLFGRIVKINILHHANFVYAESPWLWDEKTSKYLVYEFGIHMFDLLTYIFGEHLNVEQVISFQRPELGMTTEIQVSVTFKSGSFAHVTISQDSLRHSTYKTTIDVFGTAMDGHVRLFPALLRFSSGAEHPLDLIFSEIKSFLRLAYYIGTRKWGFFQNRGHYMLLNEFINCILGKNEYCLSLSDVLPTIRLLEDISDRIPGYSKRNNT